MNKYTNFFKRTIYIVLSVAMVIWSMSSGFSGLVPAAHADAAPTLSLSGVPSTVTTETAATEDANGVVTGFTPGSRTPIQITLTAGSVSYPNVRVEVTGLNSGVQLIAEDTTGTWYNIAKTGWGPAAGFNLATVTTPVYLVANTAGSYTATINLIDVSNPSTPLASTTATVTVNAPAQTPAAILSLTMPSTATVTQSTLVPETSGVPTSNAAVDAATTGLTPISVELKNTGNASSSNVLISPVGDGSDIQLWAKDTLGNWYDINVTGWIAAPGIAVPAGYDATTPVYVISDLAGSYPLAVKLVSGTTTMASASGTVTVNAPALSSIAITSPANTLSYTVGGSLDLTGLVVTGTYSDTSTQVEPITVSNVTGFDSSTPVTGQVLTITYDGQTTTYTVNINAAVVSYGGGGGGGESYNYLNIALTGSGTGSIMANSTVCNGSCSFPSGTTLTLTATPYSGSDFSGWTGDCSGSTNTCSVVLNSNKNVGAVFTATSATTTPDTSIAPQGEVLGAVTIKDGTLVLDGSTIYLMENSQKRPFVSAAEFLSWGFKFSDAITMSSISEIPQGPVMRAMDGTLALDNGTIYLLTSDGTKRGFVSAQVFNSLGYSFNQVVKMDTSSYQLGSTIDTNTSVHPDGSLVLDNQKTVWWLQNGQRNGFPSADVFYSYGLTFESIVPANSSDLALPIGSVMQSRDVVMAAE